MLSFTRYRGLGIKFSAKIRKRLKSDLKVDKKPKNGEIEKSMPKVPRLLEYHRPNFKFIHALGCQKL